MNVLGLHGVYPRSHDASACLVVDDEIVSFAEEERFLRSKKAFDQQPHNAITYCLESAGLRIDDINLITYGWTGDPLKASDILPPQYVNASSRNLPIEQVRHHEAHAASVFYTSPFDEAVVLVIDGQGENDSTSIWQANANGLRQLESYDVNSSLGYLYGAVSNFCGLGSFGAGKVMGLAPYGEPKYKDVLAEIFDSIALPKQDTFDSQDAFFNQFLTKLYQQGFEGPRYEYLASLTGGRVRRMPAIGEVHQDMAASVQALLEERVMQLAERAKQLTGSNYLCLAGGVAMNCVANSLVQNSGHYLDVFMQPACEDCGVAMGSALAVTGGKAVLDSAYKGPDYSDARIAKILDKFSVNYSTYENISEAAARLVGKGMVIGWLQGRAEFGPRALGARSIFADPTDISMRDTVNEVKQREPWRPFGPSVTAESTADLFEQPHESDFMLRSFRVREESQSRLSAVVHVDGSTRPQTVSRSQNPRFYDLITSVGEITGTPAVLNTSFNDYDEPIVLSPADALKTFSTTGLNALVLGSHLIIK